MLFLFGGGARERWKKGNLKCCSENCAPTGAGLMALVEL